MVLRNNNLIKSGLARESLLPAFLLAAIFALPLPSLAIDPVANETVANETVANDTQADDTQAAPQKPRVRRTPTLRPEIFKKLDEVRELSDKGSAAEAHNRLAALDKLKGNSYEKAMTANMRAYVYFQQEKYPQASEAYEQVLKAENIPLSLEQNTWYSLTKLYLLQEKYRDALKAINTWFPLVEKPGAEAYMLRAQINFLLERFAEAAPDIREAIALTKAQGQKPRENWLLLERAINYQNKDFVAMERCMKELVTHYPKVQYWIQLSAVYNEMGKADSELAVLESAYEQSLLESEQHYLTLAQALLERNIPYKSAQVLLEGMKKEVVKKSPANLSLLGDALMMAREHDQAITVIRQAAEASGKGRDFYRLAQIHAERQEWREALDSVNKAFSAGLEGGSEPSARVLQGMVLFNLQRLAEAKESFAKAASNEGAASSEATKATARQWLDFIDREEKRLAYMAESMEKSKAHGEEEAESGN